jgi:hypothetical protein
MISSFGEALDQFELDRRQSVFKPLSNQDILKIQMIRRSQSRYEKDLRQLLLIADSQLLADYDRAIKEREEQRKQHHRMLARQKKQRDHLIKQILVGATTLLIGGSIAVFAVAVIIRMNT